MKEKLEDMDIFIKNFLDNTTNNTFDVFRTTKTTTPMDAWFDSEKYVFEIPIYTNNPEDIDISVTGDQLVISFEKKDTEPTDRTYIKRMLTKKSFKLGWKILSNYDATKIYSEYKNGLLTVSIPFATPSTVKVNVNVNV